MKKYIWIFVISLIYILYASFVLKPSSLTNFSLIDDGQSVQYSKYITQCVNDGACSNFKNLIANIEGGRSRLGYWGLQSILYRDTLLNALFQHKFRIYLIGLLLVYSLILCLKQTASKWLSILLGCAIFVSNYSFTENIVRLGPIEPYQIVIFGLFSFILISYGQKNSNFSRIKILLIFLLMIMFFSLKEVSIAILPSIIYLALSSKNIKARRNLITVTVLSLSFFIATKFLLAGGGIGTVYLNEYKLSLTYIFKNSRAYINLFSNISSPFLKTSGLMFLLGVCIKDIRKQILERKLLYWLINLVTFTLILFPWSYVLERYLLINIFCLVVFFITLLNIYINYFLNKTISIFGDRRKFLFKVSIFVVVSNLFFRELPINYAMSINYINWFKIFTRFEHDQVKSIASLFGSPVYINGKNVLNNWEIIYEIPLHLKYFYSQDASNIFNYEDQMIRNGYIFSRTSLDPIYEFEELDKQKYVIVDSEKYYVEQIDPLIFREEFNLRPLQTILYPDKNGKEIFYYWEIRKLK